MSAQRTEALLTTIDEHIAIVASLRAERDALRMCLGGILGILGNVDHSIGHGENSAKMRGDMLNAIRDIGIAAISKTNQSKLK